MHPSGFFLLESKFFRRPGTESRTFFHWCSSTLNQWRYPNERHLPHLRKLDNLVPVTIKDETIFLCPECKEAHLKQCSQCDDFFIDTENDYAVSRDGDIYCEFCRDEYLTYCEHCDEYSDSEDFVHLVDTDEWWCRSCAERDAFQCMDCSD